MLIQGNEHMSNYQKKTENEGQENNCEHNHKNSHQTIYQISNNWNQNHILNLNRNNWQYWRTFKKGTSGVLRCRRGIGIAVYIPKRTILNRRIGKFIYVIQ